MTDIDTAALRAAAEAATPGPWEWVPPSDEKWPSADESLVTAYEPAVSVVSGWGYDASGTEASDEDRAYIAAANPAVVLELLDRLAAAEGALRWIASDAPHDGPDDAEDAMHDRAMVALALGSTGNLQGPQIDAQERP